MYSLYMYSSIHRKQCAMPKASSWCHLLAFAFGCTSSARTTAFLLFAARARAPVAFRCTSSARATTALFLPLGACISCSNHARFSYLLGPHDGTCCHLGVWESGNPEIWESLNPGIWKFSPGIWNSENLEFEKRKR